MCQLCDGENSFQRIEYSFVLKSSNVTGHSYFNNVDVHSSNTDNGCWPYCCFWLCVWIEVNPQATDTYSHQSTICLLREYTCGRFFLW